VSVEIRTARPRAWRRVREIRLRALADSPDAFGSSLERERAFRRSEWRDWVTGWKGTTNALFAAVEREAWLGVAVGSHERGRDHTHLFAMWVEPEARRRELGTGLVRAVVAWSAARGAGSVRLGVTESNAGARAFYERLGFEDTGERRPLREGSSLSVVLMRLVLPER
jgi:ribosomal protein S18 acetylase RimI-like enzyme